MAALTADKSRVIRDPKGIVVLPDVPVAASETIYLGALVSRDASGNAVAATDAASETFLGVARAAADNGSGGAGDISVSCEQGQIEELVADASLTAADIGDLCYVLDDQTVGDAASATNDVPVGRLVRLVGTTAHVEIGKA